MRTFTLDDLVRQLGDTSARGAINEDLSGADSPIQRHGFDLTLGQAINRSKERGWAKWDCYELSLLDVKLQELRQLALDKKAPSRVFNAVSEAISVLTYHSCFAECLENDTWVMRHLCEKHQSLLV